MGRTKTRTSFERGWFGNFKRTPQFAERGGPGGEISGAEDIYLGCFSFAVLMGEQVLTIWKNGTTRGVSRIALSSSEHTRATG
jgi:hypothetical protein